MIGVNKSKERSPSKNVPRLLIYGPASEIGKLDTVINKTSGSVLFTMVERYSRFTIIAKAPSRSAVAGFYGDYDQASPIS